MKILTKKVILWLIFIIVLFGLGIPSHSENIDNTPNPVTFHQNGEVRAYLENGTPGVNLVIMGDGFIKEDLIKGGEYDQAAESLAEFILRQIPFKYYRNYFNVYFIYAESKERGAESNPLKKDVDTAFNSTFGSSGIDRLLYTQNILTIKHYLFKANIKPDILLITVNTEKFGGGGSSFCAVTTRNPSSMLTALHEIGHSFANLADEYEDESVANHYSIVNVANLCNVDRTGDIQKVKWNYFNGIPGYEMVGANEGGYYRSQGIWRPQLECIMRSHNSTFCNVCRLAIVKRIYSIIKKKFSFEEFLQTNDPRDMSIK